MAYDLQRVVRTREMRGNRLVRVNEFQVVALPSETYFEFRRAQGEPCFSNPASCAKNIADRIEAVLALPEVTDVTWSQDTAPGGRLLDIMTTYYVSEDGRAEGAVEQRLAHFGPNNTAAAIAAELGAAVQELAGGSLNVDAQ